MCNRDSWAALSALNSRRRYLMDPIDGLLEFSETIDRKARSCGRTRSLAGNVEPRTTNDGQRLSLLDHLELRRHDDRFSV